MDLPIPVCSSCAEQRAQLIPSKSKLVPSQQLLLCSSCKNLGYEPRWLIILAHSSNPGGSSIKRYITKRLYVGKEITATEVL